MTAQVCACAACSQVLLLASSAEPRTLCGSSEGRDPRFDGLSGNFVDERFRKQYAFLFDEALPDEKRALRSTLQARLELCLLATTSGMPLGEGKEGSDDEGCERHRKQGAPQSARRRRRS